LWFEQGVRVGDHVLVPYERLDDGKPSVLRVDRLMRRCRCSAKAAFDLGEVLLALDADARVIAHYVAEARRRGVGPVLAELLAWAGRLGAIASVPDTDALEHAEPLGDDAERVSDTGDLPREPTGATDADAASTPEPATLGWRVLGTIDPSRVRCPRCGMRYVADDDTVDLPTCPRCGTPDTCAAAGGVPGVAPRDRDLPEPGCPERPRPSALRGAPAPRPGGVAWTRYRIRQTALDAAMPLSAAARELLGAIDRADTWALPRLGAVLYRRQHAAGAPGLTPAEWGRIWAAYRSRRPARPA
jgi:hypothetical protein